jgi:hypothetical protein
LVAQLARTLVRLDRLAAWLDQHGIQDRRGKIRSAARWESKLTSQAVSMMSALGMSPTSRAKLGLNLVERQATFAVLRTARSLVSSAWWLRQAM